MSIADITQAGLAREQWERYKQSYLPILEGLSTDILSGRRLNESLAQVPGQVESSFNLQQANQLSQMERMGVGTGISQSAKTQTDLSKAKALASSKNELRDFNKDLKEKVILGASGSMNSQMLGGG